MTIWTQRYIMVFACLLGLLTSQAAMAEPQRLALVIGNVDYTQLEPLPLAADNADQIAQALSETGFESLPTTDADGGASVSPIRNLSRTTMAETVLAFDKALSESEEGSVAFVYFAGHGIAKERRGDVYLLPTDAILTQGANLDEMGLPLADLVQLLRAHKDRTVIVVVDACRNVAPATFFSNATTVAASAPSAAGVRGEGGGWGGDAGQVGLLSRGFRRDRSSITNERADYFIAFSTSPDRFAYDSDIFSSTLADEISRGRSDLLTLFKRVGERVAEETRRSGALQLPTYEVAVYGAPPCFGSCSTNTDPSRFFDCPGCPWMKAFDGGEFLRGSDPDEKGRGKDEPQLVETTVQPFAIGVYEVTRAEWKACERADACRVLTNKNTWQSPKAPIGKLSRKDAESYLAWLSRESGMHYRLPTEAEWEFAARAKTKTAFHVGDKIEPSQASYDYSASYLGSSRAEYRGAPEPVGSFEPNKFGLFDFHGNLWEWTCEGQSAADCASVTLRGGSYKSSPAELRAGNRYFLKPTSKREDVGMRVARDL